MEDDLHSTNQSEILNSSILREGRLEATVDIESKSRMVRVEARDSKIIDKSRLSNLA